MEKPKMSLPPIEVAVTTDELTLSDAAARARKPYAKPVLEPLGDIRGLTMGGSLGAGESGGGMMAMQKP